MNSDESGHPDRRDGQPGSPLRPSEPSLEDLMAQVRVELAGSAKDTSVPASSAGRLESIEQEKAARSSSSAVTEPHIDEVMARLRRELSGQNDTSSDVMVPSSSAVPANGKLPRWQPSANRLPFQATYVLGDLLRFSDEDFIDNAYRVLLRRAAGAEEKAGYLDALRGGSISKVEVLGRMRFSKEGMHHEVHVDGLLLPYKLHGWRRAPVVGWFIASAMAVFRLPRLFAHLQRMEAASAQESQHVGLALNGLAQAVEDHQAHLQTQLDSRAGRDEVRALEVASRHLQAQLASLQKQLTGLQQQLTVQASTLTQIERAGSDGREAIERVETKLVELVRREKELTERFEARDAAQSSALANLVVDVTGNRRGVHDIERRLMTFLDRMDQATGPAAGPLSGIDAARESSALLDAHYVSFEDSFRGTRQDIMTRAGHYLTTFAEAGVEKADGLVLDLGCGRGEWLEVLTERGYVCRGVDLNTVMVGESLARGFDAVECDAVAYLRSLAGDSVAAVTSMHLVEHLPYEVLIRLLDESFRVLRPGGVLVLETPNPENLTVGAHWFYMDPTHRNPIPPTLLQWVVQARGFESAAIDRLTENRGVTDIQPVDEGIAGSNQINKIIGLLTAAPDYAIVARKPVQLVAQP